MILQVSNLSGVELRPRFQIVALQGARKKVNGPVGSHVVVQLLEVINEVSQQLAKAQEDTEITEEAEETTKESPEPAVTYR